MSRLTKKKVTVYAVKDGKLLVFRHSNFSYEEVGIQVPADTVKEGEDLKVEALRELREETGYSGLKISSYLGTEKYGMAPEKNKRHEYLFFLAEPIDTLPERWESQEEHDGRMPLTPFECFWIPLSHGHILQAGQATLLSKI